MNKQQILPRLSFILTAIVALLADQVSKMWIMSNMQVGQSIPPDGLVRLTYVRNSGVAFGLFPNQTFIITLGLPYYLYTIV